MLHLEKLHFNLVTHREDIIDILDMGVVHFRNVEKTFTARSDLDECSILFECLDSTTIGSTFVKLPGNRLDPLFRLLGILEILRRDRDQAIALIILLNDNLGAGLTLQRLDHLATRTDHSTDHVAIDLHLQKLWSEAGELLPGFSDGFGHLV